MCGANRESDQVGIEGVAGVFSKELGVGGKQAGVESFENAGQIDLGVFRVGMIAMNE